jgi:regulator of replication initiation timing
LFQISAQESRRKKKEYMDTLEKRMDGLSSDVDTYRQRCTYLEQQNATLQLQLQKLQAQLSAKTQPVVNNKNNFQNQVELNK